MPEGQVRDFTNAKSPHPAYGQSSPVERDSGPHPLDPFRVMAALEAAIQDHKHRTGNWMTGSSPAMEYEKLPEKSDPAFTHPGSKR